MRKFFKNICIFLLWLAGLTLIAHQIIPHDHHLSDVVSKQVSNCTDSNSNSFPKSGFPIHCHAFNVLDFERIKPIQNLQNFQFSFLSISILTDSTAYIIQSPVSFGLFDISKQLFESYILKLSFLRAPPSLT